MKNIEIKITGSGKINQVGIQLHEIARLLLNTPEDVKECVLEDDILLTEITDEFPIMGDFNKNGDCI